MKAIFNFHSINARLRFWFFLSVMIPLTSVIIIIYNQRVTSIKKESFAKLTLIRDFKVLEVNSWFDERVGDINNLSDNHYIKELETLFSKTDLSHDDTTYFQITRSELSAFLKNYNDYNEIFLIDPATGQVKISTNISNEGISRSDKPYFIEPMKTRDLFIQDINYSETTGKLQMAISKPIICSEHDSAQIIAVLVMRIDLHRSLYELLLNRTGMGKTGETLIVDKNAIALNELRWYENAPLNLKIDAKPAIRASLGESGLTETADYRGEKVLAAFTYIPRLHWGFIAKQDFTEIYAPVRGLFRNLLIILGITLILAVVIANWLANSLALPIIALTDVAKHISEGHISARNESKRTDELGYLARSFDNMADAMESKMRIQAGNSELLSAMVAATGISDAGHEVLKKLIELTDSQMGAMYLLDANKEKFEHFASIGINSGLAMIFSADKLEGEFGKVLTTKEITHLKDIPNDTSFTFKTVIGTLIPREIITIPLIVDKAIVAIISIGKLSEYSKDSIEILDQTWISMSAALSNQLANEKIVKLAEELTKTNVELQVQTNELDAQTIELEQQNRELEIQQQNVEAASLMKSQFLSNMSHELRTPLNSVLSLSSVLLMQSTDKLSDEEARYLEIIHRNGKHLLDLINDILDLAKIESGHVAISTGLFSINSTVDNILDSLESTASEKGLNIFKEMPATTPQIESDEGKLYQILQNILANAVKFTDKGYVKVSISHDEKRITIKITDTGIGIPQDQLSRIFEEFIQVDGTTSRLYEGTGLGLAIARKTVHLLSGDISIESTVGTGTTFTVTLPIIWQGVRETSETALLTSLNRPELPSPSESNKSSRILIVEDNEAAIIQIKTVLASEGYMVDVATGGQEALDYMKETIPDCIILDLMMPDIDGFQVLEQLRSTPPTAHLPVLVLTAKDLTPDDLKSLSANNIQQLIQKGDVNIKDLLFKVKLALGSLPKKKTEKRLEQKKDVTIAKPQRELPEQKLDSDGKKTVLIVEDNSDNMISVKAILGDRFHILEAVDGEEGLQTATTDIPDLILLDIALPKMDGFTVARKLRENSATEKIPILAVTASAMRGAREKIIEADFDEYVAKPIDADELIDKMNKWL